MNVETSSETQVVKAVENHFNLELLRVYYAKFFPYQQMFDWLSYGCSQSITQKKKLSKEGKKERTYFRRREFNFTLANDVFIRYLSFRDVTEFKKAVQSRQPHKMDIGPVYSFPCSEREKVKAGAFVPEERELVFDIDLTDYEGIGRMLEDKGIWENE